MRRGKREYKELFANDNYIPNKKYIDNPIETLEFKFEYSMKGKINNQYKPKSPFITVGQKSLDIKELNYDKTSETLTLNRYKEKIEADFTLETKKEFLKEKIDLHDEKIKRIKKFKKKLPPRRPSTIIKKNMK